jgi:hypothetical protein
VPSSERAPDLGVQHNTAARIPRLPPTRAVRAGPLSGTAGTLFHAKAVATSDGFLLVTPDRDGHQASRRDEQVPHAPQERECEADRRR